MDFLANPQKIVVVANLSIINPIRGFNCFNPGLSTSTIYLYIVLKYEVLRDIGFLS